MRQEQNLNKYRELAEAADAFFGHTFCSDMISHIAGET
jgi:hypothetical protein